MHPSPKYTSFAIIIAAILLTACTPSYTADTTERYVREVGISNQFEIRRWHSRAIPSDTRISIVASTRTLLSDDAVSKQPGNALAEAFALGFSVYFSSLHCATAPVPSMMVAKAQAEKNRSNFLFYIDVVDRKAELKGGDTEEAKVNYKQLTLVLTVVDVLTEQVIDKIQLSAKPSLFNFVGTDLNSLLAKPIDVVARELTGA